MKKILVVDDVEPFRKLQIRTMAIQLGANLSIEEACNGAAACEYVIKNSPDLVLMDIQMPDLNGIAATTKMRISGYNNPIILWTGNSEILKRIHNECDGANEVLDKMKYAGKGICKVIEKYI